MAMMMATEENVDIAEFNRLKFKLRGCILLLISFSSLLNKVACLSPLVRGFVSFNGGAAAMSASRMTVANSWMGCFSSFSDNGWKMVEHWGVELVLCFRNKGTILKCQAVISILGYQIGGKWQWVCCLQLLLL